MEYLQFHIFQCFYQNNSLCCIVSKFLYQNDLNNFLLVVSFHCLFSNIDLTNDNLTSIFNMSFQSKNRSNSFLLNYYYDNDCFINKINCHIQYNYSFNHIPRNFVYSIFNHNLFSKCLKCSHPHIFHMLVNFINTFHNCL